MFISFQSLGLMLTSDWTHDAPVCQDREAFQPVLAKHPRASRRRASNSLACRQDPTGRGLRDGGWWRP
jgi:hypothetical protein